jgi:hypothetical protein
MAQGEVAARVADVRALVGILLVAQTLDAPTTWLALSTGRFEEVNPWLDEAVATHPLLTYAVRPPYGWRRLDDEYEGALPSL